MRFLDYSLWWGGLLLETAVLLRGFKTKLMMLYPVFYSYVLFVLLQSLVRITVYHYNVRIYSYVYWTTEFLGVAIGSGVVFEIYRVGLAAYPGTAQMARRLLAMVFCLALAKGIADVSKDPRWWAEATTINVERAIRTVQTLAIAALVALFLIYAIPFGRNLKGIVLGYGLFICASLMWFTFANAGGDRFRNLWSYLNPLSYAAALVLWNTYLWAPEAETEALPVAPVEEHYQLAAARTRRRLQQARGYLGKVIGQ